MPKTDRNLTFNFRWSSNAQGGTSQVDKVKQGTDAFARYLVREVAISAADNVRKEAARTLRQRVQREVQTEINRMAKHIARSFDSPSTQKGPFGSMSIRSQNFDRGFRDTNDQELGATSAGANHLSDMAKRAFGSNGLTFNRQDSGIQWNGYSPRYARERTNTGHWFRQDSDESLKAFLQNQDADSYEAAFGGVNVVFNPRRNLKSQSNRTFEDTSVSMSGRMGPLSQAIQIGTLEVLVFNKITPAMMSGLATMNPVGSKPMSGNPGVAGLLYGTAGWDPMQTAKLLRKSYGGKTREREEVTVKREGLGRNGWGTVSRKKWVRKSQKAEYRPALDPFVSFYLTRAIPNAIWRRLERFVYPRERSNFTRG